MEKVDKLTCYIFIFAILFFAITRMGAGYYWYLVHKENYTVCDVRIIETEKYYIKGPRVGYFYFYDNNNHEVKGKVFCNFWEDKGDVIKIAFNAGNNIIRPEICIDDLIIQAIIWVALPIGYLIWHRKKK